LVKQVVNGLTRYYFFRDEQLWKIVVVFDAGRAKDFDAFVALMQAGFQAKPRAQEMGAKGQSKRRVSASWHDELTVATARDRRDFFSAYLVRFIQKGQGEGYQAGRTQQKKSQRAENGDLTDLFSDNDGIAEATTGNVVDDLTGEKHEVDLSRGRLTVGAPVPTFEPELPAAGKTKAKKKGKAARKKSSSKGQPVSKPAKIVY
jgi:hypothetical protein